MTGEITLPSFVAKAVKKTRRSTRKSPKRRSARRSTRRSARRMSKRRSTRRSARRVARKVRRTGAKRRTNGFALYVKKNFKAARKGNEKATTVMKRLAAKWRALSAAAKAKY